MTMVFFLAMHQCGMYPSALAAVLTIAVMPGRVGVVMHQDATAGSVIRGGLMGVERVILGTDGPVGKILVVEPEITCATARVAALRPTGVLLVCQNRLLTSGSPAGNVSDPCFPGVVLQDTATPVYAGPPGEM